MWADNETKIDLLGFDFLVDELELLLSDERLLPVTVGVFGDWGSGKSSLMGMAKTRLETGDNQGRFVCVSFSPWRFEDIGDGKVALMAAVIDAIAEHAEAQEGKFERTIALAGKLREALGRWGIWRYGAAIGAAAAGAGPEEAVVAASAADAISGGAESDHVSSRGFETVAHFHVEFEELVESLGSELQAVVVFIDDMDRCSTETIVETFEAMRLFLHAPKTAYVVGAHAEIVEAALDGRYPDQRAGDESLGRNYLEKMLQNTVAVPPLSEPEVQTYINLLFSELRTSEEQFANLCQVASENRGRNQLSVAMNEGIANEALGGLSAELVAELAIAAQVGPTLGRGLRGNPRQIKRFLNRFLLRVAAAQRRSIQLDPDKLAKLMLLEELYPRDFERLFIWHLQIESGAPQQLVSAEELAAGQTPEDVPAEVTDWLAQPGIKDWLLLDPAIARVSLGPYFTFSRDRLAGAVTTARLPVEIQALLAELQNPAKPKREKAVEFAAELDTGALAELMPPLLEASRADNWGPASQALLSLAGQRGEVATAMLDMLATLPIAKLKSNFVLAFGAKFKDDARAVALLENWFAKGSSTVKRQSGRVLGRQ